MNRIVLILCASLALAACSAASSSPPVSAGSVATTGPAAIADRTALDEQVGLSITLAYTVAARSAALAINTGIIKDKATIARIGELNRAGIAAVRAVRAAYETGNQTSYTAAAIRARAAIATILSAFGDKP